MLLYLALLTAVAAFQDYSPETYPDSLRQPVFCGVEEPGYLCDPNGILKAENGSQLRLMHALVNAQSNTKCICDQLSDVNGRCDGNGLGYIMSIALTQKMVLNDDERDEKTVLRAAEVFADRVRVRQNRGHCGDDLLIFLSQYDNAVSTSVGDATKRFLSNEMIISITTHAEEFYFKSKKYYDGLNYMVENYQKVLNGEKVKITETKHWYYPLPTWAIITIFVVVGLLLLAVIGISVFCIAKHCCCNDGRGRYAMASSNTRL